MAERLGLNAHGQSGLAIQPRPKDRRAFGSVRCEKARRFRIGLNRWRNGWAGTPAGLIRPQGELKFNAYKNVW
ncbi:hypothetical protein ABT56_22050, partial [Photobacterium aquae]